MRGTAAPDDRVFAEVKRLCCAGLDGPELLREAIGHLRQVVPFESYCASTVDPASSLITHALAEEVWGDKEAGIFFNHLYFT